MLVLIVKPGTLAVGVVVFVPHMGIEKCKFVGSGAEQEAAEIGGQTPNLVIEANDDNSIWLHQARNRFECTEGIGGVMQNTIGDDQIERTLLKCRAEQVHLNEAGILDSAPAAKTVRQPQRVQAHI